MSDIYKKILVPLDGSDLANRALPYARELAALAGAKLIAFRVVPDLREEYQVTAELQFMNIGLEEQQTTLEHATHWLQRQVDGLKHEIAAEAVVEVGEAASSIVDYAAANDVDLIVMSTHGRTGLARWGYGSVANKVLHAANCPVLIVRAQFD